MQALASYTFSHSIDSASTDAFATYLNTPASLARPNIDRGDSDFDIRNAFTAGVTYDLPCRYANTQSMPPWAVGRWTVSSWPGRLRPSMWSAQFSLATAPLLSRARM